MAVVDDIARDVNRFRRWVDASETHLALAGLLICELFVIWCWSAAMSIIELSWWFMAATVFCTPVVLFFGVALFSEWRRE